MPGWDLDLKGLEIGVIHPWIDTKLFEERSKGVALTVDVTKQGIKVSVELRFCAHACCIEFVRKRGKRSECDRNSWSRPSGGDGRGSSVDELISRVKSQSLIKESLSHSTVEAEAVLEFLEGITTIIVVQELQGRFGGVAHKAHGLCVGQCVGCKFLEVNRDVLNPFIDPGFGFLWCRGANRRGWDWGFHYHVCKIGITDKIFDKLRLA
jgi:hypothetical protein